LEEFVVAFDFDGEGAVHDQQFLGQGAVIGFLEVLFVVRGRRGIGGDEEEATEKRCAEAHPT
jgi:hypothetical protein